MLHTHAQDSLAIAPCKQLLYDVNETRVPPEFDATTVKKFKEQKDFDYGMEKATDDSLARFKNWLYQWWKKIRNWYYNKDKITGFWGYIFRMIPYILIFGLLALVVWLFTKISPEALFSEPPNPPEVLMTEEDDIIQNQDIDALIKSAIAQQNYRMAIRYYYLAVLKKMTHLEIITWESQKTNSDYLQELKQPVLQDHFRTITRYYDFIWYGNFEINEQLFEKAEKEFIAIHKLIP